MIDQFLQDDSRSQCISLLYFTGAITMREGKLQITNAAASVRLSEAFSEVTSRLSNIEQAVDAYVFQVSK